MTTLPLPDTAADDAAEVHDDPLTPQERACLRQAEARFAAAGGRGPELADEIDRLRLKRDGGDHRLTLASGCTCGRCDPACATRLLYPCCGACCDPR